MIAAFRNHFELDSTTGFGPTRNEFEYQHAYDFREHHRPAPLSLEPASLFKSNARQDQLLELPPQYDNLPQIGCGPLTGIMMNTPSLDDPTNFEGPLTALMMCSGSLPDDKPPQLEQLPQSMMPDFHDTYSLPSQLPEILVTGEFPVGSSYNCQQNKHFNTQTGLSPINDIFPTAFEFEPLPSFQSTSIQPEAMNDLRSNPYLSAQIIDPPMPALHLPESPPPLSPVLKFTSLDSTASRLALPITLISMHDQRVQKTLRRSMLAKHNTAHVNCLVATRSQTKNLLEVTRVIAPPKTRLKKGVSKVNQNQNRLTIASFMNDNERQAKCPFKNCSFHDMGFPSWTSLLRHIETSHFTVKHICHWCTLLLSRNDAKKRHIRRIHDRAQRKSVLSLRERKLKNLSRCNYIAAAPEFQAQLLNHHNQLLNEEIYFKDQNRKSKADPETSEQIENDGSVDSSTEFRDNFARVQPFLQNSILPFYSKEIQGNSRLNLRIAVDYNSRHLRNLLSGNDEPIVEGCDLLYYEKGNKTKGCNNNAMESAIPCRQSR